MTALLTLLRQAENAPAPADADSEIVESLRSLADDTEDVSAFVKSLIDIDQSRAAAYLVQCRAHFPKLFANLVVAEEMYLEEEDEGDDMGEEMPMEDEEPEGGELPPLATEELPDEEPSGQTGVPTMPMSEEDEDEDTGAPMDEEVPPEMGMDEDMGDDMGEEIPPEPAGQEMPVPPMPMSEEDTGEPMEEDEGEGEEVAVEPVVDPEELESEEANADDLDMVLFEANTNEARWAVFYRARPLCEIRLADQENPRDVAQIFGSDDYPRHIKDACSSSFGIRETLNSVSARWYFGVVQTGTVAAEAEQAAAKRLENEFASRLASLKEDLLNTVHLAITASNKGSKGLFVENKLKLTVAQAMRESGIANPTQILNEIWTEAATEYVSDLLRVAEKWLAYSPEAMQEVTAEIVGTDVDDHEVEMVEETPAEIQQQQARAATKGIQNVPIRTRVGQPHGSEPDYHDSQRRAFTGQLSRRMGRRRAGL